MSYQWPDGRRHSVAIHESGHALAWMAHGYTVESVSLRPGGGGACYPPEGPKGGPWKLIKALACLCGEAAERVLLGRVTDGGSLVDHQMFDECILAATPSYREMRFEAVKAVFEDLARELCVEQANRIERLADVLCREEYLGAGRIVETLAWGRSPADGFFLTDGWPHGLTMRLKAAGALTGLTRR